MSSCKAQYLLWAVVIVLGVLSMFGCGAKGELYLPKEPAAAPAVQPADAGNPSGER